MGFNPAFKGLIIFLIYIFKYFYVQLEERLYGHLRKRVTIICSFAHQFFINLGVRLKKDTFKEEFSKIMWA
jgi:hypothetical protein